MKEKIIRLILIFQCILYVLFLYMDAYNLRIWVSSNILKMASIILCLVIALLIGKDNINLRDRNLLVLGMLFTVIADIYLLILDKYILGVISFSIVQMTYYIRYKKDFNYKDIVRAGLPLLILLNINMDLLILLGIYYAFLIGRNLILSFKLLRNGLLPRKNAILIFIGMIFFILCDINVAIAYIFMGHSYLEHISNSLIWVFYLPSQVLLALSGYRWN